MINGFHHLALVVEDIDKVVPYYCEAAGLHRVRDIGAMAINPERPELGSPSGASFDQCLLAGPNGYLNLLSHRHPTPPMSHDFNPINQPGIRHFCIQNHDCSILEKAVLGNDGSLIAPPLDLGTGNQYAYARDPEGNIMEIEGLPYAPADEPTWMGHVAIVTRDMDAAVEFYSKLLETEVKSRGCFGPGPQFDRMSGLADARLEGAWLPAGNMQLELWQFHAPEFPRDLTQRDFSDFGYSHICLETDTLGVDAARLEKLGGELISQIAESEHARSIYARDPEGNVIKLLELRELGRSISISALADPKIGARVEAGR
jgi:catechol 2,3-dioxygenase-like lactoylglutathione lyase family enzyme